MTLSWVVYPILLAGLCLGNGLLVERCAGRRMPGALLAPAGFALVVAASNLLTYRSGLVPFALPALVIGALAGLALAIRAGRDLRPGAWPALLAVGVFLCVGAPAALSGQQTFSGSLVLPDTANQLLLAQRLGDAGRDYTTLPTSSYRTSLAKYLSSQYPAASQAAVGVTGALGFTDVAWVYQPFLAFMMAMAALALYLILHSWIRSRALSAVGAFLAAQPALTYSNALQGSIKEIAAVALFAIVVALVTDAVRARSSPRGFLPVALTCVAMIGALGPAAAPYLLVPVGVLVLSWLWPAVRNWSWRTAGWGLAVVAVAGVLLAPFLGGVSTAYQVSNEVLSQSDDLGHLAAPLELRQVLGVWFAADFRYPPDYPVPTAVLSLLVLALAVLGVIGGVHRRAWGPLLFVGTLVAVSSLLLVRGSAYADAKVLALCSPALVMAAVMGVHYLARTRRLKVVAAVLGAGVAVAVLGSNALAYNGVQNAPAKRYAELLSIGDRYSGKGPALVTEYDEYGGYLLHKATPINEPESTLAYRGPPFRRPNGRRDLRHRPAEKSALDLDDLDLGFVLGHPLIVQRHSPVTSRPPADYAKVSAGRYYDVWRRQRRGPRVLAHLPLGRDALTPSGAAPCGQVRALASRARRVGGELAYVARPVPVNVSPLSDSMPSGWFQFGNYPGSVVPGGRGTEAKRFRLLAGGRYDVWMGGSYARALSVRIDGKPAGSVSFEPGNPGQYFPVGRLKLLRGAHTLELTRGAGDLRPGDGGGIRGSGVFVTPIVLSPAGSEPLKVETLPPSRATELCGRPLDWVEIVRDRR